MNTNVINIICGHNNCGYPHIIPSDMGFFTYVLLELNVDPLTSRLAKGGLLHVTERFELDFKSGIGGAFRVRVRQVIVSTSELQTNIICTIIDQANDNSKSE